jgi:DNA-binding CsgD family transcriptional regulator
MDPAMKPIFVDPAAARILVYPQHVEAHKNLGDFLAGKIRSTLLAGQSASGPVFVSKFHSGKRLYFCHAFRVNGMAEAHSTPSIAVLFERTSRKLLCLAEVSEKFHLTVREQEVIQHLFLGLTSKEVATRMGISANTVKAFLRLIMVKMGVSTRSGIIGRAFSAPPDS